MEPKSPVSYFECLTWVCHCGSSNGIEPEPATGGWYDLDCSHCGIVGSLVLRPSGRLKPAEIQFQAIISGIE